MIVLRSKLHPGERMEEEKTGLSSVLVSHIVCAGFSLTPAGMIFAHLSRRILMMIHRVCISFAVPVNSGNSKCIQLNVCLKTFFSFPPIFLGRSIISYSRLRYTEVGGEYFTMALEKREVYCNQNFWLWWIASAHVFCQAPDRKYFRLCRPYGLHGNFSSLLLYCESSHRHYVTTWMQLCSNKTLFTKTASGVGFDLWVVVCRTLA